MHTPERVAIRIIIANCEEWITHVDVKHESPWEPILYHHDRMVLTEDDVLLMWVYDSSAQEEYIRAIPPLYHKREDLRLH